MVYNNLVVYSLFCLFMFLYSRYYKEDSFVQIANSMAHWFISLLQENCSPVHFLLWVTSRVALANARASSIVGWKCSRNKWFHWYHINSKYVRIHKIIQQLSQMLGKQNITYVSNIFGNLKFVVKWLPCHVVKHLFKWYWICKFNYGYYMMLDQYARLVNFDKKLLNWDKMIYVLIGLSLYIENYLVLIFLSHLLS